MAERRAAFEDRMVGADAFDGAVDEVAGSALLVVARDHDHRAVKDAATDGVCGHEQRARREALDVRPNTHEAKRGRAVSVHEHAQP